MMTPWGRVGGSQENERDLGPLADMAKFAGGLPEATGGPTNMGINILHVHPKNISYKLTCFQCTHCPVSR